jgi:hypothetical protein
MCTLATYDIVQILSGGNGSYRLACFGLSRCEEDGHSRLDCGHIVYGLKFILEPFLRGVAGLVVKLLPSRIHFRPWSVSRWECLRVLREKDRQDPVWSCRSAAVMPLGPSP